MKKITIAVIVILLICSFTPNLSPISRLQNILVYKHRFCTVGIMQSEIEKSQLVFLSKSEGDEFATVTALYIEGVGGEISITFSKGYSIKKAQEIAADALNAFYPTEEEIKRNTHKIVPKREI